MPNKRPWNVSPNHVLSDVSTSNLRGKSLKWLWARLLCLHAGYSVVRSSDSVSVADSDLWDVLGTFDPTKIVSGANVSAIRSWMLLSNGTFWVLIDCRNIDSRASVRVDSALPTGGTVTAVPTVAPGASYAEVGVTSSPYASVTTITRVHLIWETTTGHFLLLANSSGQFTSAFAWLPMSSTRPEDTLNGFLHLSGSWNVSSLGVFHRSSVESVTGMVHGGNNGGSAASVPGSGATELACVPHYTSASETSMSNWTGQGTDGRFDQLPCHVYLKNQSMFKGVLDDCWWAPGSTPQGTQLPIEDGAYWRMCAGDWWVPWAGTELPLI